MVSSFGRGCCNQAATARGGRSQLPLHPDSKLIRRASQPCRARSRASSQLCQCLGKVAGEKVPRSWGNNPPPSLEANRPPLSLHPSQFCQVPSACHAQASPSRERVVPGRASMLIYGFSWHIALPGQEMAQANCRPSLAWEQTWEKLLGPSEQGVWGSGTSQDLEGSGQGCLAGGNGEGGQWCPAWTLGTALQER